MLDRRRLAVLPLPFRTPSLLLLASLILLLAIPVQAQSSADTTDVRTRGPGLDFTVGGLLQTRLSYGWTTEDGAVEQERLGAGVKRGRLRFEVSMTPRVGAFIHLAANDDDAGLLDAFLYYRPAERWRLRLGRLMGAQPRAKQFTSVPAIDGLDRAAIADLWAQSTLGGSGRDFGVDVQYRTPQVEASLFLHNGDGSWDRARGNMREGILNGDPTGGVDRSWQDLAVSAYVTATPRALPGVELGGFAGYNGSHNPNTVLPGTDIGRAYESYAAHLYWGAAPGSQRVRLKADLIGIRFEDVGRVTQHTFGLAVLGAVGLRRGVEVYGRVEQYEPNLDRPGPDPDDGARYVEGGLTVSPSAWRGGPFARHRITLGYAARLPDADAAPTAHLLALHLQLVF
jgi:hypothetical protein